MRMEPGIAVVGLCIIVALTHKFWAKAWDPREDGGESATEPAPPSFALTESQAEWDRVQRELGELPPLEACDEILPPEPAEAEREWEVEPFDAVPFARRPVRGWLKLFWVLQIIGLIADALTLVLVLVGLGVLISQAAARGEGFPMISLGVAILTIVVFAVRFLVVLWFKRRQMRFRAMYSALIAISFFGWCASALINPPAPMASGVWLMIHSMWIPYLNRSPQVETMFSPPPYR